MKTETIVITVIALAALGGVVYLIARPAPEPKIIQVPVAASGGGGGGGGGGSEAGAIIGGLGQIVGQIVPALVGAF